MQMGQTVTCHLTPIKMTVIKKDKHWQGRGEIRALVHCKWECKMVQALWKTVRWFLGKLEIELRCDPAILLGIYTPKN